MRLFELKWVYLLSKSWVRIFAPENTQIASSVKIQNSKIYVYPGAKLIIDENVFINNCEIHITKGSLIIGYGTIIKGSNYDKCNIIVNDGHITIGNHTKISNRRIWVRFGGQLTIGDYTNINSGGEIRCDEHVVIGNFNQISYEVNIWDTNTHSILPKEERRNLTKKYYPYYGFEIHKPKTSPIKIGDDCWISARSTILKGSIIGNEVVVGYNTTLVNKHIPSKTTIVPIIDYKIINV